MDEEEQEKGDYRTKIQFFIVEMSRETLYFCPLLTYNSCSKTFHSAFSIIIIINFFVLICCSR